MDHAGRGCLDLIAILVGASYVHDHPASLISYALASTGFKLLEPSFTVRRKGVLLFDRLQSYQSLAEVKNDLQRFADSWRHQDEQTSLPSGDETAPLRGLVDGHSEL